MNKLGPCSSTPTPRRPGDGGRGSPGRQTGAMNNLGLLLRDGDPAAARSWWERAAQAGHTGAMNNLGALL